MSHGCRRRKPLSLYQGIKPFVEFLLHPVRGQPGDDKYFLAKLVSSKWHQHEISILEILAVPVCYDTSNRRLEYVPQELGCLVKLEKNLVWPVAKYDEFFLE